MVQVKKGRSSSALSECGGGGGSWTMREVSWCPCFCTVWGSLSSFSPGRKWLLLPKEFKNPSYHHSLRKTDDPIERTQLPERERENWFPQRGWMKLLADTEPWDQREMQWGNTARLGFCIEFWMKAKPSTESAGKDSVFKWCTLNVCWNIFTKI